MTESTYGRQPNRSAYVKLFYNSIGSNLTTWNNIQFNGSNVLAPVNKKSDVYVYNNLIVGGSIVNPSDVTLKTNVEVIPLNIANQLMEAVPKKYVFKKDIEEQLHYGFIAQELEEICPQLVQNIETPIDGKIKSVNYLEMIPLLLLKIKDLQTQVDELKQNQTQSQTQTKV
jgi:hypothetical protein